MICPKCGSNNVTIQVVNEAKLKTKHNGIIWWLCIGWWWLPIKWIFFTVPALFIKVFSLGHKKQKIVNVTKKKGVCQSCGEIFDIE